MTVSLLLQQDRVAVVGDAELARRLDACVYRTIGERVREAGALLRHRLSARFSGGDHHGR